MICPQCGSSGSFRPRRREAGGYLIIFVMCPACPYEKIVRSGSTEVVELEMDVERLRGRVEAGEFTLKGVLATRERRLEELRLEMARD